MARRIRIEYPGACYHVMARGNRRESIYADEDDRRFFLKALGQACGMTGWRVHAWLLMSNHYHLLIETPEANLVRGGCSVWSRGQSVNLANLPETGLTWRYGA